MAPGRQRDAHEALGRERPLERLARDLAPVERHLPAGQVELLDPRGAG
jgi:hypothetical protein